MIRTSRRSEIEFGIEPPGLLQQCRLAHRYLVAGDHLDPCGLVVSVLEQGNPAKDVGLGKRHPAHRLQVLRHRPEAQLVADVGPLLFAHADHDHLHEPAFAGAAEGDVRFDAIHHGDPIGLGRKPVDVHREPVRGYADLDRLHARADGGSDGLLGDAHAGQHVALSFGGGAAVAAHGREEEGFAPGAPDLGCNGLQDQRQVGDAPAAGGHGNAVPRLHPCKRATRAQLIAYFSGDVGQPRPLERLTDLDQAGNGDRVQESVDRAHGNLSYKLRVEKRTNL